MVLTLERYTEECGSGLLGRSARGRTSHHEGNGGDEEVGLLEKHCHALQDQVDEMEVCIMHV